MRDEILDNSPEYKKISRKSFCYSSCPSLNQASLNDLGGDYVAVFRMDQIGTSALVDTGMQSNDVGIIKLSKKNAIKVAKFDNPLENPLTVSRETDGTFTLKDGYHRFCEAKARNYNSVVFAVITDASIESDEEE